MNVGIVGLGLIGGSMARSIKERTGHRVYGIDLDGETMSMARLCGSPGGHIRRRQRSRTEEPSPPPAGGPPVLCGSKKIARPARCVRCRARNATCQRDGKMVY